MNIYYQDHQDLEEDGWDCPTCLRPMADEHDYECGTCEAKASEHLRVTTMCKLLRASQARESALIARQKNIITAAKAVIDRWETPFWKEATHTGAYIAALRKSVEVVEGGQK